MDRDKMDRAKLAVCGLLVFLAVLGAYANHFQNAFHFDDAHAVVENPYIRSLTNLPKFFVDAKTFSSLPTNQSYRPIVTATLAVDYHLAKGLTNTTWYQVDTFIWFIALLVSMYFLFVALMDAAVPSPYNGYLALFAVALFGLHPVCAETVNYVVQRGEVHSTLGVALGLVIYIYWPRLRPYCLYLLPVIVGSLSKPPALMFLPILFVYVYLYESDPDSGIVARGVKALLASIPAGILFAAMGALQLALTPKTYVSGGSSTYLYWLTQPSVILHYLKEFFLPTDLSADTDRVLVSGITSEAVVLSVAILAAILSAVWPYAHRREMRPFTFGLWWFAFALAPTSLQALSEVENDHRMFFPFVGLTLAAVWAASQIKLVQRHPQAAAIAGMMVLGACGWGTHQRNIVWRDEASLWKDVTEKSPRNGRGLMNYGLTLLSSGNAAGALELFQRAEVFTPSYPTLKLNLGITYGLLGNDAAATASFQRALELAPNNAQCYFYYARYLAQKNQDGPAISLLRQAIALNPGYAEPRYLLMQIYSRLGDALNLRTLAEDTRKAFPGDTVSEQYLRDGARPGAQAISITAPKTAEDYLSLSLQDELAGKHEECIQAAMRALALRPGYAEAYNNIAAANQSMGRWDAAIENAQIAIQLKPDFQLAKNNLQYSLNQKRLYEAGAIKK